MYGIIIESVYCNIPVDVIRTGSDVAINISTPPDRV